MVLLFFFFNKSSSQKKRYSHYLVKVFAFPLKNSFISFEFYYHLSKFLKTKAENGTQSVKLHIWE